MDQPTPKPTAPETPAFTLTEGQLRKLIREEVQTAIIAAGNGGSNAEPCASPKPYLTVKEAADFARVAPSTIRLYIRKRQLRARKVGRRVIVAKGELEAFLGQNPVEVRLL
jgi:excisionase family DNA binding protein